MIIGCLSTTKRFEADWLTRIIYVLCFLSRPIFCFPVTLKSESSNLTITKSSEISENNFKFIYSNNNALKHSTRAKHEQFATEYDYDNLLQEYYDDNTNGSYTATEKKGLLKHIRKIFLLDGQTKLHADTKYTGGKTVTGVPNETWKHVSRVFKMWLLMYLIIAFPLWCLKGWCCCCLFCRLFKPQRTIDEAKKYLVTNPPGVLKLGEDEMYYDPTDYEKEAYEKFEHMLRTI